MALLTLGYLVVDVRSFVRARVSRRASERPPWRRAGMLAVLQDDLPVDEHVLHAGGVLVRLLEGRAIRDRRRIEDRDVGEIAFA